MGPSYRSGPGFCPTINATESQEILVSSGIKKAIRVKVHIIGVCQKSHLYYILIIKFFFLIDVKLFFYSFQIILLFNIFIFYLIYLYFIFFYMIQLK